MIIGLTGNKRVGKDTAAQFLVEERGYQRMGFADKLKEATAALFDMTPDEMNALKDEPGVSFEIRKWRGATASEGSYCAKMLTWRHLHQRMGTEVGRNVFGLNFWIDLVLPKDARPIKNTVFSDVRFSNEALRIIGHKGYIIQILRPDHEPDGHASENPLPEGLIDATVTNDGDLNKFRQKFLAIHDSVIKGVIGNASKHV